MKEAYLHHLWQLKRLPFNRLRLTNGKPFFVINPGWLNPDSGPDFFNAQIEMDGLIWTGNVEIHLKSSDWYLHQHQHDQAYKNVILHVVLIDDRPVQINGKLVPTVELKDHIDAQHLYQCQSLVENQNEIACSKKIDPAHISVQQQKDTALFQRINRKGMEIYTALHDDKENRKKALYYALLTSFGGRANKLAFQELANALPLEIIIKESHDSIRMNALLFGVAGWLKDLPAPDAYSTLLIQAWQLLEQKYQLVEMDKATWKTKGIRPWSFPQFKLAQLGALLQKWQQTFHEIYFQEPDVSFFKKLLVITVDSYWKTHYQLGKLTKTHQTQLTDRQKNEIIINGFLPYWCYLQIVTEQNVDISNLLDALSEIPAEVNYITQKWKAIGVSVNDASDSQALIEQYNSFCINKRCLSCKIGTQLLDNKLGQTFLREDALQYIFW